MAPAPTDKSVPRRLKDWLFPTWRRGFVTAFSGVGYGVGLLGTLIGLCDIFEWTGDSKELSFLHGYLWFSLGTAILLFIGFCWVAIAVVDARGDFARQTAIVQQQLAEKAKDSAFLAYVQHAMAEVVREYVARRHSSRIADLDKNSALRDLLNSLLVLVREESGQEEVSIVIKYIPLGKDQLVTALRLGACVDGTGSRPQRPSMINQGESEVFRMFKSETDRSKGRLVSISDALALPTDRGSTSGETAHSNLEYSRYADNCGFRSVLAFPMRDPSAEGTSDGPGAMPPALQAQESDLTKIFAHIETRGPAVRTLELRQIKGFLSFDCPNPNGFESLLKQVADDPTYRSSALFQTFFGITDALAIVMMAMENAVVQDETLAVHRTSG